ncbi:MAG: hypothetical protein GEU82_05210 [Luteitalea sp.]|nr:hypothetical protein [Luteitalea sp.]
MTLKKIYPRRSTTTKSEYRNRVPKTTRPIFSVCFKEGLATRNRLPLDHVIRVLNEIKGMMQELGRRVQREQGAADPTGDFGLELIAGFQRGSVQANIVMTRDVEIGVIVAAQILDTVSRLGATPRLKRARRSTMIPVAPMADFDPRIVNRLNNIGKVQEIDKTKMELTLRTNGMRPTKAVLDTAAVKAVSALREPNLTIEGVTVYGKLRELHDKYDDDDDGTKAFFGELLSDDGEVWRIEFKPRDVSSAALLFRRQVFVTGTATYYQAVNPKLHAIDFGADDERDYEAAFDELYGSVPELAD